MKIPAVTVALTCLTPVYAQQHGAHQHEVASLEVFVDANVLELRLESPLDNLVGFEGAPRTQEQRETLRAMVERFRRPESLFVPPRAAGCSPGPVTLESVALYQDLLKVAGAPGTEKGEVPAVAAPSPAGATPAEEDQHFEGNHADLDVVVTFNCTKIGALNSVNILLFQAFPRLRRLEAQVVTTKGQRAARLTAESNLLRW